MRITNEMIKNNADTLHDRNNIMEKLAAMLNKGNDYFMVIDPMVINMARLRGQIKEVASHGDNVYYDCPAMGENVVLMHIKDNKYTVINHRVDNSDIVEEMSKMSFSIGMTSSNRGHIMTRTPKNLNSFYPGTLYFTRAIKALEVYGEHHTLDANYDVHHEGLSWDNRCNSIQYISKEEHKNKNGHLHAAGYKINSYCAFDEFCDSVRMSAA